MIQPELAKAIARVPGAPRLVMRCESEVEAMFVLAFCLATEQFQVEDIPKRRACKISRGHQVAVLQAQFQALPSARVDFAFFGQDDIQNPLLVVEIDGFYYHQSTVAQVTSDRARDRALLRAGLRVMRFTGSELNASPVQCAVEAFDTLVELFPGEIGQ